MAMADAAAVAEALRRDFDAACEALAGELAASDAPTRLLAVLEALVDGAAPADDERADPVELPPALADRLDAEFLPRVVQLVLGRSFRARAHVNRFLQWTLARVARRLRRRDATRLPCLARVLDARSRFYVLHGGQDEQDEQDEQEARDERGERLAPRQFARQSSSCDVARNVECWGRLDGFSLLLALADDADAGVDALLRVLRVLCAAREQLQPSFLLRFFPRLVAVVRTRVREAPAGDLYALPRDALQELVQALELLLAEAPVALAPSAGEQQVRLLQLELSRRFLRGSSLEKRLWGLSELVLTVTRLYNEQLLAQREPTAASLRAALGYLLAWLHETQVVPELLGATTHVELLKRSAALFHLASELERLPAAWLDLVWRGFHAGHEAFRTASLELLLELVAFLEPPLLRHVVQRVEALGADVDADHLALLAAVAARSLGAGESLAQRILLHLWRAVLPAVRSEALREQVLQRMHDLLRRELARHEDGHEHGHEHGHERGHVAVLRALLRPCLANVSRRRQLVVSLTFLARVAQLVSDSDARVSDALGADSSCVRVVLGELRAYKRDVARALEATPWRELDDARRAALAPLRGHVESIKLRLLALRAAWLLDTRAHAPPSFGAEDMALLWDALIADAFVQDEAALCFQWIELCMNTPRPRPATSSATLLPLGVARALLATKFRALAGAAISLSTLCCFHSLFRRVNVQDGGLASPTGSAAADTDGECVDLVTAEPLVGLDELWHLAIAATDADVAEEASALLASFHLAFVPALRATELPCQRKRGFLDTCMAFLVAAKANAARLGLAADAQHGDAREESRARSWDAEVATVKRCVDLLRYFLQACDAAEEEEDPVAAHGHDGEEGLEASRAQGDAEAATRGQEASVARTRTVQLEHLEERLPFLDIFPSPMKDEQLDAAVASAKLGFRAARRPSWTFRQQHALLDVIVDGNEEGDEAEETPAGDSARAPGQSAASGGLPLLQLHLDGRSGQHATTQDSPLRVDVGADFLKPGTPVQSSMRSPTLCVRANLHWPEPPSPQHGPDLNAEEVRQALTAFASHKAGAGHESVGDDTAATETPEARAALSELRGRPDERKAKYGLMSQLLANHGPHFAVLMDLVDWDEPTAQRAWDLLCRLPTNNELLRQMIRLRPVQVDDESNPEVTAAPAKDVEWPNLLDTSNTHRLLYALRLVEALLIPIEKSPSANPDRDCGRRQWRERFLRLGGGSHLYNTLLQWPMEHFVVDATAGVSTTSLYAQNLRATCIAAVIRTLGYFLRLMDPSAAEKISYDNLSAFDLRLQCSTLPEFVKTMDLAAVLRRVMEMTEVLCSRGVESAATQLLSVECAEAVLSGSQMCCSLLVIAPELAVQSFVSDDTLLGVKPTGASKRGASFTVFSWLKTLLLDCPSSATRTQLLEVLSNMATASSSASPCSASWTLFEQLVVSSCELVVSVTAQNVQAEAGFEQLFSFSHFLLQRCTDLKTDDAARSQSEPTIALIVENLMEKHVPDQLMTALYRSAYQQHEEKTARGHSRAQSQHSNILEGLLDLLALLVTMSDGLRQAVRGYKPEDSYHQCGKAALLRDTDWTIAFVLKDLLFGELSAELDTVIQPICESSACRAVAQRLLLSLFAASPSEGVNFPRQARESEVVAMSHVLQCQRDYQERVLESVNLAGRQWNYTPADMLQDTLKAIDYAGLVNPGCICYMNALVQQLFMMPTFRDGLLALDSGTTPIETPVSSSWKDEVQQLQKLFTSMAYTTVRSIDPTTFALSHKDMDGNPTDVRLQMDADEFFSLLLDRVEMHIRPQPTPAKITSSSCTGETASGATSDETKDFMERCFGGVLVNQVLTQQGHLSEREEKFFALSLEVSKKRYLTESLALYVQGESLEGENAYFCERVQQKVSATKRVCIKTLPQTLVCHLKRFEFDFDTMEKVKINDYLEFPSELDMFPYTSEALTPEGEAQGESKGNVGDRSIMYDLVGVVVHSGTADTGHYYSFIKDRREAGSSQRWLEFNDEVVRDFDDDTMDTECFGGEEVISKWDPAQETYAPTVQMKRRSAYMLIYEQREATEVSSGSAAVGALAHAKHSTDVQRMVQKIELENARFRGVVNAFDVTYEQFVFDVVDCVAGPSSGYGHIMIRQTCQSACQYLFGIVALRSRSSASSTQNSGSSEPRAKPSNSLDREATITRIVEWLSSSEDVPSGNSSKEDEQVVFSSWVLAQVVASPVSASLTTSGVEMQRSWLFDVLFLNGSSMELANSCFRVLAAAVSVLARRVVKSTGSGNTEEQVLVKFFREVLDLFYEREQDLDVRDAGSGGIVTVSVAMRVRAVEHLGRFLESVCGLAQANNEVASESVVHCLLLEKLHILDRFLLTLQTACSPRDAAVYAVSSALQTDSPATRIASFGIESDGAASRRASWLRFSTFCLETRLLDRMLQPYAVASETQSGDAPLLLPPVDTTLLMNHAAIKNILLLGLEDLLAPVLIHIAFDCEGSTLRCDRLVSLLVTEMEEVKTTHVDKMLVVFGHLLDAEEARAKPFIAADELSSPNWNVHRHIFSPSRGILEGAVYYKDHHSLHEFTFVLLEFTLLRAGTSRVLQTLFRSDAEFRGHVDWIPDWIVHYLDANGAIRQKMEEQRGDKGGETSDTDEAGGYGKPLGEETQLVDEVQKLFTTVEKVFGVAIHCGTSSEESEAREDGKESQQPLSLPLAYTDDILLESLASDTSENQAEIHESERCGKSESVRGRLKASGDEVGPQHDREEAEEHKPRLNWLSQGQPREDLAVLLRLDLDAVCSEAREA